MYYLLINGQKTGPYEASDIQRMLRQQAIGYDTQFWKDGMFSWETIGSHRQMFESSYRQPPQNFPPPQYQPSYQPPHYQQPQVNNYPQQPLVVQPIIIAQGKSRVAFILLGLFLGGLGIHNFYAGYAGKGIAQLLLNLFLFWTIVVPVIVGIWVLIEVITVDRDSFGNRMI